MWNCWNRPGLIFKFDTSQYFLFSNQPTKIKPITIERPRIRCINYSSFELKIRRTHLYTSTKGYIVQINEAITQVRKEYKVQDSSFEPDTLFPKKYGLWCLFTPLYKTGQEKPILFSHERV